MSLKHTSKTVGWVMVIYEDGGDGTRPKQLSWMMSRIIEVLVSPKMMYTSGTIGEG